VRVVLVQRRERQRRIDPVQRAHGR
jgi:hypothetical protein